MIIIIAKKKRGMDFVFCSPTYLFFLNSEIGFSLELLFFIGMGYQSYFFCFWRFIKREENIEVLEFEHPLSCIQVYLELGVSDGYLCEF